MREYNHHKTILGVELSGDTLDYSDGKVLTGCRLTSNQIKIYNPKTYDLINHIDLDYISEFPSYVSTAKFCQQTQGIFAIGTYS